MTLLCAAAAGLPWVLGHREPRRRVARHRAVDLAVVLDLAAAAVASGASVPGTLEALGVAIGEDDLAVVARALQLGAAWDLAWAEASARYAPLAEALAPAWLEGVGPHPMLVASADHVRSRRHQQAREAAERLAVRLVVPLGLCQLPAFVLLGLVPVLLGLL
ncbi:hypothetical protein H8R10_04970 [Winkia sp. C62]|uniref:Type II secretion system protein GspF domain-containing protein n=2 Tax=Nanchangia anserum TaxID=2692125 RepID=A0A8I0GEW5_9ACTO|nr:hypothetical protein [Nanchangia anserum]